MHMAMSTCDQQSSTGTDSRLNSAQWWGDARGEGHLSAGAVHAGHDVLAVGEAAHGACVGPGALRDPPQLLLLHQVVPLQQRVPASTHVPV